MYFRLHSYCQLPGMGSSHLGLARNGNHHRVAANKVSKAERGGSATSVHGFVMSHLAFIGLKFKAG